MSRTAMSPVFGRALADCAVHAASYFLIATINPPRAIHCFLCGKHCLSKAYEKPSDTQGPEAQDPASQINCDRRVQGCYE